MGVGAAILTIIVLGMLAGVIPVESGNKPGKSTDAVISQDNEGKTVGDKVTADWGD